MLDMTGIESLGIMWKDGGLGSYRGFDIGFEIGFGSQWQCQRDLSSPKEGGKTESLPVLAKLRLNSIVLLNT